MERHYLALTLILATLAMGGCAPLYQKANLALEEGEYEEAVELFDRQLDKDDNPPEIESLALAGKGYALERMLQHDPAIDALSEAIRVSPHNYMALVIKADILIRQGEVDQAIQELTPAVARHPSVAAYAMLGQAHWHRGDMEEAAAAYDQALRFPADAPVQVRLRQNHARCAFRLRQWNAAKSDILQIPREQRSQEDIMLLALASYAAGDKYTARREGLKQLPVEKRLEIIRTLADWTLLTDDVIFTHSPAPSTMKGKP